MSTLTKHYVPLILALTCLPQLVAASGFQSHKSIMDTAENHARTLLQSEEGDIELSVSALDSRLRLHQCALKLTAFSKTFQRVRSNITVGVKCNDTKAWTLYVPIKAAIFRTIPTLKNSVERGQLVSAADLSLEKRDITRARRGYFSSIDQVVGKIAKRNLRPGDVVTSTMVKVPHQVKRGNKVTIVATAGNISVRMTGKALSNGTLGQRIQVLNTRSEREVEGIVVGPSLVKVVM